MLDVAPKAVPNQSSASIIVHNGTSKRRRHKHWHDIRGVSSAGVMVQFRNRARRSGFFVRVIHASVKVVDEC